MSGEIGFVSREIRLADITESMNNIREPMKNLRLLLDKQLSREDLGIEINVVVGELNQIYKILLYNERQVELEAKENAAFIALATAEASKSLEQLTFPIEF